MKLTGKVIRIDAAGEWGEGEGRYIRLRITGAKGSDEINIPNLDSWDLDDEIDFVATRRELPPLPTQSAGEVLDEARVMPWEQPYQVDDSGNRV